MANSRAKMIKSGTRVRIAEVDSADRFSEIGTRLVGLTGTVMSREDGDACAPLTNNGDNTYSGSVRLDRLPRGRGAGIVGDTIALKSHIHRNGVGKPVRHDVFFDAVKVEVVTE